MATTQRTAAPRKGGGRSTSKPSPLPPVTVAKLEETGVLLEQLVEENQQVFTSKTNAYREVHREASRRGLTPLEAAEVAQYLADSPGVSAVEEVQQSSLTVYDEPDVREVLLAAGLAAAPQFITAVRRIAALIEMPADVFEKACTDNNLDTAISEGATQYRHLELDEAKARVGRAFAHYAQAAGFESGEAWRLPVQAVWQALQSAASDIASRSSQLTDSAASTAGSPPATSDTGSPG